ncbi:MAG: hypothetical protein ACE5OR_09065 [bacterium]
MVHILSYVLLDGEEAPSHTPKIIHVDSANRIR